MTTETIHRVDARGLACRGDPACRLAVAPAGDRRRGGGHGRSPDAAGRRVDETPSSGRTDPGTSKIKNKNKTREWRAVALPR